MTMTGVSIFGWLHTLGATLAILVGALVIFGAKGTQRHRYFGRVYVYTMLATNVLSFGVYHFDIAGFVPLRAGAGIFGLFHWEAVFTLFFLLLGWFAATRQRRVELGGPVERDDVQRGRDQGGGEQQSETEILERHGILPGTVHESTCRVWPKLRR